MFKPLHILAILLLGASFSAQAEWSKQYDFAYTMGDGDTKGSARQAAIEQIKIKASNEAGTYVDSTTTLREDGNLTESIQMIRATMVKIRVDKESMSINPSGQAALNLVVLATLDDAELAKRVEALRQDKEKARQLKVLQAENEALRASLSKIRDSLAAQTDPATVASLLSQQDQTFRKLDQNSQSVTQVFSKGALLQLALQNKDAFENKKKELEDTLYAYFLRAPVRAAIEGVEQDGDGYIALVRVGWDIDLKKVEKMLGESLVLRGGIAHTRMGENNENKSPYVVASEFKNEEGKGKNNLSHRIFDYLAKHPVVVKVSIGGDITVNNSHNKLFPFPVEYKTIFLPVMYGSSKFGFSECQDFSRPVFSTFRKDPYKWERPANVCVTQLGFDSKTVLGSSDHRTNPLRIRLTKEQAESATRVMASIETLDDEARVTAESRRVELEREDALRADMAKRAIEQLNSRNNDRVYLDMKSIRSGMGTQAY